MDVKLVLDGDITVVALSGRMEIEKAQAFKAACLRNFPNRKIVFCMRNLSFVGSSGIQSLFSALSDLNSSNKMNAKIAGLNQDFTRLFQFSECPNLELHENVETAIQSF